MSPHRLSFSTLGCPELPISAVIELARVHRFAGIELRCLAGAVLAPANFDHLLPDPLAVRNQLQATGRQLTGLGTSVKLLEAKPADLKTLSVFGQLADALDCPYLRVFDGGQPNHVPLPAELQRVNDWYAAWIDLASRQGIRARLMVETHDGLVAVEAMRALRAALPDLSVLWDLHHTWRAGTDAVAFGELVADALVHVHLKDSVSRPSARKPFTYVRPGAGEFDWVGSLRLLDRLNFAGYLSFEWERQWHPDLEPLAEVLDSFAQIVGD